MPPYAFGPFLLDATERRLLRDHEPVVLTPKAFDLLCLLVERNGHLVLKEDLLHALWPNTFVEEANLNRCVSVLRKALRDGTDGSRFIETVPTRGYRFVAPVAPIAETGLPIVATSPGEHPFTRSTDPQVLSRVTWRTRRVTGAIATIAAVSIASIALWTLAAARTGPSTAHGDTPAHRQATFAGREGSPALSPDGRWLAYVSATAEGRRIVVQELDGDQPVTIATATEAGNLRWSPDASSLLFFARDQHRAGMYVVPRAGGEARLLAPGFFVACWSPDGQHIAVAQPLIGRVVLLNAAGRAVGGFGIAGAQRWIGDVDWSAVTNRLLVVGNDVHGRHTIWTIAADGSNQHTVITEAAEITAAKWAPDGESIYYFRRDGQTITLAKWSMEGAPTASSAALLTGLEADGSFALSADGTRLVYARTPFYSNLHVVDRGGPSRGTVTTRQLTHGTSLVERPRISPDGTQVLFSKGHEANANLYRVPLAGGEASAVTFFKSFNVGGAWSPDGRSIAFGSTEGGRPRVWVTEADGHNPRAVSSGDFSDSFDLQWSAAGDVLYQQAGNRNYYVLDVRTGRERPFMSDTSVGWVFSPVVSPDGTRIVFGWSRQSGFGLWVRDTRNASERLLYGASIPTPIGWSPDGRSIYAYEGERAESRGLPAPSGETSTRVKIVQVSETGRATVLLTLPFDEVGGITMTPDGRYVVCAVYSTRSDVWVVEHFDGGSRSGARDQRLAGVSR